jgi:replicative DNA helicase
LWLNLFITLNTIFMANSSKKPRKKVDAQIADVKVLPHSVEAEQSVLGGLMLDNTVWDRVADTIMEDDFYNPAHQLIFHAISDLTRRNQPFDVLTLTETLKNRGELENAGGEVFLFELARNTPTVANITAYAEIVRERSILRKLIETSGEIVDLAFNPDGHNSKEILDKAESKIFHIAEQRARGQGPTDISTLLAKATERIDVLYHSDSAITGLSTGFSDLDDMTSGIQRGDMIIIAGRPSMGKTALAMNIAEHAAIKNSQPILVFSMEMPGESLAMRMMSSLGHIDQHKVRTGKLHDDDWPRLTSAVSMLSEAPLFIDDTPSMSPGELRARARRLSRTKGQLGLIVIDYIQLMQVPGFKENRTSEITEISRSLKALAKELNVPVLALSQLNRSLEQRGDRRPVMSDLRESGAIEQDADLIVFIYRDEVYHEDSPDKGVAEIIIAKQRNGPIGKVKLTFLGQYTRFENFIATSYSAE